MTPGLLFSTRTDLLHCHLALVIGFCVSHAGETLDVGAARKLMAALEERRQSPHKTCIQLVIYDDDDDEYLSRQRGTFVVFHSSVNNGCRLFCIQAAIQGLNTTRLF